MKINRLITRQLERENPSDDSSDEELDGEFQGNVATGRLAHLTIMPTDDSDLFKIPDEYAGKRLLKRFNSSKYFERIKALLAQYKRADIITSKASVNEIEFLKFEIVNEGKKTSFVVIPHITLNVTGELMTGSDIEIMYKENNVSEWAVDLRQNPVTVTKLDTTILTDEIELLIRKNLMDLFEDLPYSYMPSDSAKIMMSMAEKHYQNSVQQMRTESSPVDYDGLIEMARNNPLFERIDEAKMEQMLQTTDKIKSCGKYYINNVEKDIKPLYDNNPKRFMLPIIFEHADKEDLLHILEEQGLKYDGSVKGRYTAKMADKSDMQMSDTKWDYKSNTKLRMVIAKKHNFERHDFGHRSILTSAQSVKYRDDIRRYHEKIRLIKPGWEIEDTMLAETFEQCYKFNTKINEMYEDDFYLRHSLDDFRELYLKNHFISYICLFREQLAKATLNILKRKSGVVGDEYVKMPMQGINKDRILLLIRPGPVSKGSNREVSTVCVGKISRQMLDLYNDEKELFNKMSIYTAKENFMYITMHKGEPYVVFRARYRTNEAERSIDMSSLISSLMYIKDEEEFDDMSFFALWSNLTNRRVSEEQYTLLRLLLTMQSRYIMNYEKLMKSVNDKWRNEPFVQGYIVDVLQGKFPKKPMIYVALTYARLSPNPVSEGAQDSDSRLAGTMGPMNVDGNIGLMFEEYGSIHMDDTNNRINYYQLMDCLSKDKPNSVKCYNQIDNGLLLTSDMSFSAKGSKLDPHSGDSRNAMVAYVNMINNTNANNFMDLINWFADNYLSNEKVAIHKEGFNKVLYLAINNTEFPILPKKEFKKWLKNTTKSLPSVTMIDFRVFARFLVSIKAKAKENERGKAEVRSIFLMSYFLFQCQQFYEQLASIFIEDNKENATITMGEYEKKVHIMNNFRKMMREVKTGGIYPVDGDNKKWHACQSTLVMTIVNISKLSKAPFLNQTAKRSLIQGIIKTMMFANMVFSVKRLLVTSLKTVFLKGVECQTTYTNLSDECMETENSYIIKNWFKDMDSRPWGPVNEKSKWRLTMTLPGGINKSKGFFMGFMNKMSTLVHDIMIPMLRNILLHKLGMMYNELHSSDDDHEIVLLKTMVNRLKKDGLLGTDEGNNILLRELILYATARTIFNKAGGICTSLSKYRMCGPHSLYLSFEYTSANAIISDQEFGWVDNFIRDSIYKVSYRGISKAIRDVCALGSAMVTTNTVDYKLHYPNMITLLHRCNNIYNLYNSDAKVIYHDLFEQNAKAIVLNEGSERETFLAELLIPETFYFKYVPLGKQALFPMQVVKTFICNAIGGPSAERINALNSSKNPCFDMPEDQMWENNFGKDWPYSDLEDFNKIKMRLTNKSAGVINKTDERDHELLKELIDLFNPIKL